MNTFEREAFPLPASWGRKASAIVLGVALLFAAAPLDLSAEQDQPAPAQQAREESERRRYQARRPQTGRQQ